MKSLRIFAYVIAILLLATAVIHAAERPVLRGDVVVTGNLVRIGDLVENAGVVAEVPVFRAPRLGETGRVPVGQVLEALRAHALIGLDPGAVSEVNVTRASRVITVQDIEGLVAKALARDYALGDASDVSITFDRALRDIHIEAAQTGAPRVSQSRFNARSGEFDAVVEIPGASVAQRLGGTAVATQEVVTLTRSLSRGEVIKVDDLAMRRVPRAAAADAITDPDQVIGLAPRAAMSSNRVLRSAELMKPEIVARGAQVTISYQVPGVMLALRGKAQEGGAEGDMIDVVNVQSNRTLRATVTGPGQVSVISSAARVIAAAELPESFRNQPLNGAK